MSFVRKILIAAALTGLAALPAGAQTAPAPAAPPPVTGEYVVSYIEVAPDKAAEGLALVKGLRAAALKHPGVVGVTALQRTTHPHHFALLERWADNAAREAHAAMADVTALRQKLAAIATAPFDERPHRPLAVGEAKPAAAGALVAVTHVDFIPTAREQGEAMVTALAGASRGAAGNLRFDGLTQASRPNHFTLVEVWADPKAWKGHAVAPATKTFRQDLLPKSGSLYDERLYRAVK
ncbi:MAG: antibiotic biosynthesis monooxygenase [Rhodoplanes sp.]|uniref:putative quinol monooxygenase n=1 Tax=Rhodoplanes sp. TaxID=1968906 RepID=UPI0017FB910D|nr:antibiotic biosynthesis monooxygenase [Rhodoplanes sp.]NVO17273.1 antibiotic biosynthesis monooxygenase [Rhodoplanes sp.]